jgi:hypothetical protein
MPQRELSLAESGLPMRRLLRPDFNVKMDDECRWSGGGGR